MKYKKKNAIETMDNRSTKLQVLELNCQEKKSFKAVYLFWSQKTKRKDDKF